MLVSIFDFYSLVFMKKKDIGFLRNKLLFIIRDQKSIFDQKLSYFSYQISISFCSNSQLNCLRRNGWRIKTESIIKPNKQNCVVVWFKWDSSIDEHVFATCVQSLNASIKKQRNCVFFNSIFSIKIQKNQKNEISNCSPGFR